MACFIRINAEDGARHYVNLDLVEDVVEHVDGTLWIRLDDKYGIRLAKNSPDGVGLLNFLEGRTDDEPR